MDKHIKERAISTIILPDYLVKTLKDKGMSLEALTTRLEFITNSENDRKELIEKLKEWFNKNISRYDLEDIYICNRTMIDHISNSLYKCNNEILFSIPNYDFTIDADAKYAEFLKLYSNPDIDTDSIILSSINNKDNELWSVETHSNIMFIVLHKGFTNFIVYNSKVFIRQLSKILVNLQFNVFGEKATVSSCLFKMFIRLK